VKTHELLGAIQTLSVCGKPAASAWTCLWKAKAKRWKQIQDNLFPPLFFWVGEKKLDLKDPTYIYILGKEKEARSQRSQSNQSEWLCVG